MRLCVLYLGSGYPSFLIVSVAAVHLFFYFRVDSSSWQLLKSGDNLGALLSKIHQNSWELINGLHAYRRFIDITQTPTSRCHKIKKTTLGFSDCRRSNYSHKSWLRIEVSLVLFFGPHLSSTKKKRNKTRTKKETKQNNGYFRLSIFVSSSDDDDVGGEAEATPRPRTPRRPQLEAHDAQRLSSTSSSAAGQMASVRES